MRKREWIAIAIMVQCVAGIVALVVADPGQQRIKLSLDDKQMRTSEAETTRWAEHLLDSPVAALLDPRGHDRLQHAVDIEHRVEQRGGRNVDEISLEFDIFGATNDHQVNVHNLRWSWFIFLGMTLAGSVVAYVLWRRDSRSGLWFLATMLVFGGPMLMMFIAAPSLSGVSGIYGLALWLLALGTIGRESAYAMRLRT